MKTTINLSTGRIKIVNFTEFLLQIAISAVDDRCDFRYTVMKKPSVDCFYGPDAIPEGIDEENTSYLIKQVNLMKFVDAIDKPGLKNQLSSQLRNFTKSSDSLWYSLENVCVESAMNCGQPDFLVRMGPRKWLVADSKSLIVFQKKSGLSYFAETSLERSFIVNVSRKNEADQ